MADDPATSCRAGASLALRPEPARGLRHRARSRTVTDGDLIAWLVDITDAGPGSPTARAELARWLAAAVPRHHWTVLGQVWCSIHGLDGTRAEVIRVAGPTTPAEARRVLWAVRRRAWGAVRDERAAESAHHRHEIPAGDFRGGAVA